MLHSPEVKQAAVIELCTRQTSAGAVAQKLAVSRPTLYKWKNQLLGRVVPTSMKLHNDSPPDPERLDLEQQVEALQRDIRKLQLEHDLLKKANELLLRRWLTAMTGPSSTLIAVRTTAGLDGSRGWTMRS